MTAAPRPLATFIEGLDALLSAPVREAEIFSVGRPLLQRLIAHDAWLPAAYAVAGPKDYSQYLLYLDPPADGRGSRFSIVSFAWAPGQATPVHNHTVWGLIGVMRGEETSQRFRLLPDGRPVADGPLRRLARGEVEVVSPDVGDIHQVSNALDDQTSVSLHVYGSDIGRTPRAVFGSDGRRTPFISGYSNGERSRPFGVTWEAAG